MSLGDEPSTHPRDEDERETYADVQARADQFREMGFFKREASVERAKPIEWKETVATDVVCQLLVFRNDGRAGRTEEATPDDLRAACAAVGMSYVTPPGEEVGAALRERDEWRAQAVGAGSRADNAERREAHEKARAEKAEGEVAAAKKRGDDMSWQYRDTLGKLNASVSVRNGLEAELKRKHEAHEQLVEVAEDLRTKLAAAEDRADTNACIAAERQAALHKTEVRERNVVDELNARIRGLESRLSALTAPVEGEPSFETLDKVWNDALERRIAAQDAAGVEDSPDNASEGVHAAELALWRAGYAACAARHQPTEPRATDGAPSTECPLCDGKGAIVETETPDPPSDDGGWNDATRANRAARERTELRATEEELLSRFRLEADVAGHEAGVLAVAARVRREQCLVERAVAGGVQVEFEPSFGNNTKWNLYVDAVDSDKDAVERRDVPSASVPTVLAEMLGEVGA